MIRIKSVLLLNKNLPLIEFLPLSDKSTKQI